ncbi:MAG: carboxy terminal-processing peptidase [Planctomycetaceae bacterium]|nr:carboxy terminal-processing peptidase [Planctomycetaceae bacterium]
MKRFFSFSFVCLLVFSSLAFSQNPGPLAPTQRDRTIAKVVEKLLRDSHLFKRPTDEMLSERSFELFFKALDPNKTYFYQSDVDEFAKRAKSIGEKANTGDIGFAFDVFNLYLKRADERIDWGMAMLDNPIDLSTDDEIVADPKNLAYPKTEAEAQDRWMKQVKLRLLTLKADEIEKLRNKAKKEAKEEAKEKGIAFDPSKIPTTAELESQVPDWETLQKRLKRRNLYEKKRIHQKDNDDLLEYFLTAIANAYDPHTSYMSPSSFVNFMIQMGLNLDGIGATLTSIDGFTVVNRLVPDGPADKSGLLKAEDRIVAVGQGANGPMVDVFDMRLDDVVAKVRGKRGTQVRLEVVDFGDVDKYTEYKEEGKPKPATKVITITREKVELKEQAAKSTVFEAGQKPDGTPHKIGVIVLPSFYFDLDAAQRGDPNYRSAANDVRRILRDFVAKNVDAVVLDLRFNGGGSLSEVVSLTGLFIETGTVVMTKNLGTQVTNLDDRDPSVEWTGPLVVVANKASASASEIFAGAIKDYGRGLIVGDSTTHGKGSVQDLKDISKILFGGVPNSPQLGALKLTVQGYYLPGGNSPQTCGVTSDVEYPSFLNHYEGISESDLDYPLSFEKIPAAIKYPTFSYTNEAVVKELREKSAARVSGNSDFQKVLKDIQIYLEYKAKKTRTLNEKKYFEERERLRAEKEETDKLLEMEDDDKDKIERNYYMNEVLATTVDYMEILNAAGITFPKDKAVKGGVSLFNLFN